MLDIRTVRNAGRMLLFCLTAFTAVFFCSMKTTVYAAETDETNAEASKEEIVTAPALHSFSWEGNEYSFANEEGTKVWLIGFSEETGTDFVLPAEAAGYECVGFDSAALMDDEIYQSIETVTFSGGISEICDYCCTGMSSLREVYMPRNIIRIGNSAFAECQKLYYAELSDTVKVIGDDAFLNCESLSEDFFVYDQVESIGAHAFSGTGIVDFEVPSSVTDLGEGVFQECRMLEKCVIKAGVKKIPKGCFENCVSLKEVSFGKSVNYIFSDVFTGCNKLKTVRFKCEKVPSISINLWCPKKTVFKVPKKALSEYKEVLGRVKVIKKNKNVIK